MQQRKYQYLSLAALIILMILYSLTSFGLMGDNPVGQTASYTDPLIVPAGYAFSIWGLIYLGLIVFPIYQIFNKKERSPLWQEVHLWYSLNVVLNGLWLVFASYDWLWTTVGIIILMLISLIRINDLLNQIESKGEKINYWAERLVFSLYFAWITLATALNFSSALTFYEWAGFGISAINWALIILPVVALIAGVVFRKYRDVVYAGVVIWAFIALAVKQIDDYPSIAYLSVGLSVIFLILILTGRQKIAK